MAKIINITDRLENSKPKIVIGEKEYEINNSMEVVLKFEELLSNDKSTDSFIKAIEIALGKEAAKELDIKKSSMANFKIIVIAIMAAIQDLDYEEAESRFQM